MASQNPPIDRIDLERLQQFGNLELLARQVVEGFMVGLHKSPFHGFSVEFAEHRLYNPGDSTRHIDWKLFGRTERMYTKKYEEETNLRCQLVIDNSSSMYFPEGEFNKIQFSIYCSAAIQHMLRTQRDAIGLTVFSNAIEKHLPSRSAPVHLKMVTNELEQLLSAKEHNKTTSTAQTLHTVAESIHKRSLVVIFSDMLDNASETDEIFHALQHLKYNGHEVLLFHVMDRRHELEFDYGNRPSLFIDMETGERVKLNPSDVRDYYTKKMKAYREEVEIRAHQYKIDYIEADIRKGFRQVLLPYLMKRIRMK